ncbi:uncharacterized protein [Diadema antillarum]|uniref:uncharacterized protein n=1 Tax=Diadema antillarum TaxID=105358 RepID=UPI003A88FBFA
MPTSSESRIHVASTYNLRSRPVPKTTTSSRKSTAAPRKNVRTTGSTGRTTQNSKRAAQSKIPVPRSTKPAGQASSPKPAASSSTPTRRKVPDFEKLHKAWANKFQQGKAVAKKPCTQARAFDLTRPGTRFKRAYFDGNGEPPTSDKGVAQGGRRHPDDFEVDNDALQSILNGDGLDPMEETVPPPRTRSTLAGTGKSMTTIGRRTAGSRQTLGVLPSRGAGRVNNASNFLTSRNIMDGSKLRGKSLLDEQKGANIEFAADADALASILNDTGLGALDRHGTVTGGRQTIAGTSLRQRQSLRFHQSTGRNSIYYQKPKNYDINKVYSEFAKKTLSRLTIDRNTANVNAAFIESLLPDNRGSIYFKRDQLTEPQLIPSQSPLVKPTCRGEGPLSKSKSAITPGRVAVSETTRGGCLSTKKTPGTASRVPNLRAQNLLSRPDLSCSPALKNAKSGLTPARRIPTTPGGQSQKAVRWADVLTSPADENGSSHLKTQDVVAVLNFGEDAEEGVSPETKSRLQEVEKLEAETAANRHKLNEMEEIERQLEMEIARLHEAEEVEQINLEGDVIEPIFDLEPVKLPRETPLALPQQDHPLVGEMTSSDVAQQAVQETYGKEIGRIQSALDAVSLEDRLTQHQGRVEESHDVQVRSAEVTGGFVQSGDRIISGSIHRAGIAERLHVGQSESAWRGAQPILPAVPHQLANSTIVAPEQLGFVTRGAFPQGSWGSGPDAGQANRNGMDLVQADSTEFYRGVFPAFLQNSPPGRGPTVQAAQRLPEDSRPVLRADFNLERDHIPTFTLQHMENANIHAHRDLENNNAARNTDRDYSQTTISPFPRNVPSQVGAAFPRATQLSDLAGHNQHSVTSIQHQTMVPSHMGHRSAPAPHPLSHSNFELPVESSTSAIIKSSSTISTVTSGPAAIVARTSMPSSMQSVYSVPRCIQTPQPLRARPSAFPRTTPTVRSISTPMLGLHPPPPIQTPLSMRSAAGLPVHTLSKVAPVLSPVVVNPGPMGVSTNLGPSQSTTFLTNIHQPSPLRPAAPAFSSVYTTSAPALHPTAKSHGSCAPVNKPSQPASLARSVTTISAENHRPDVDQILPLRDSSKLVETKDTRVNLQSTSDKETIGQLFHHVLLDQECALYSCGLKSRFAPQPSEARPMNPVAKIMLQGDELHFIPVSDTEILVASPSGSAFSNFQMVCHH